MLWTFNKNALSMTEVQGRPLTSTFLCREPEHRKTNWLAGCSVKQEVLEIARETYFPQVLVQLLRQKPSLSDVS